MAPQALAELESDFWGLFESSWTGFWLTHGSTERKRSWTASSSWMGYSPWSKIVLRWWGELLVGVSWEKDEVEYSNLCHGVWQVCRVGMSDRGERGVQASRRESIREERERGG
jgi:hypothetical protein